MAHNQMTISTDFDLKEFQDDLFKILFKILFETASSAFLFNLHSPESGLSRVIADQIRMINNQMIADYGGLLACRWLSPMIAVND